MKKKRIAQFIALGEFIVALPMYQMFGFDSIDYWMPMNILTNVLSFVFLVLPVLALYGISKDRSYGYLCLGLFPLVALLFGVFAVPFVKYLFGSDVILNTVFIVLINILVTASAIWLYYTGGLRSNQSLNR